MYFIHNLNRKILDGDLKNSLLSSIPFVRFFLFYGILHQYKIENVVLVYAENTVYYVRNHIQSQKNQMSNKIYNSVSVSLCVCVCVRRNCVNVF